MDKLNTIKQNAANLATAKGAAGEAKSIANSLIGQALYLHLQGTLQEKVALQRWVGKGEAGEKFKQYVSKGKAIAEAVAEGVTFILKDSEVESATLAAASFENLPQVTFTALYNSLNAEKRAAKGDVSREKQCLALGAEAEGLSAEDVKALSASDKATLIQAGEAILANLEASESKKVSMETFDNVKTAIAAMTDAERAAIIDFIAELESAAQAA